MAEMDCSDCSEGPGRGCFKSKPVSPSECPSGSMRFSITQHPNEALGLMNQLRLQDILCDVKLRAESREFPAHRLVLASASPYFKAMFCNGMLECCTQAIYMHGLRPGTLETLIEFAYTSEIDVSEMNVCSLLPAATMLQMTPVVGACCEFLEKQLDPTNCIGIADFAQAHGCMDLYDKARKYLYTQFPEVAMCDEFLTLSAPQVKQVIRRDELTVRCESDVYSAAIRWVRHDVPSRINKLEDLLCGVRCHFLTPAFLKEQLTYCDLISREPNCRQYLSRVLQDLFDHKRCSTRRRTSPAPLVLYIIGGYLQRSLDNMECFNPSTSQWTCLQPLPTPRSGIGVATVHGLIYVIGGRNNSIEGHMDTKTVDEYDPFMNRWRRCADMNVARNRVGVGVLDGEIYALGGSSAQTYHNSVEKYNPIEDSWMLLGHMSTERIGAAVAVVNRLLYAIGGYDGRTRLNSVECYNPDINQWHPVASLNVVRSGAGVSVHDQFIYVVGGYDGTNQLKCIERYDVELDEWQIMTSMHCRRSALNVAMLDNKIYAFGGYDGVSFLSTVEAYDLDAEEWTMLPDMSCPRSGHGVAVAMEPCTKCEA